MSEVKHFARMVRRAPRADVAILLITFLLTVLSDLVIAVNIGVILAMLHFMRRMASSVGVHEVAEQELEVELRGRGIDQLPPGVLVYDIEGPLFFGAAETFERALAQTHTDPRVLIIRLHRVPFMDITGLETLREVIQQLKRRGIVVRLCEANHRVDGKLRKVGVLDEIGDTHYHADFPGALAASS
ncbi:C4-dicarboxylic acid transporter DauA [compost metagenome]